MFLRIAWNLPWALWKIHCVKKVLRKSKKGSDKYPLKWRFNFVNRLGKRLFKTLKIKVEVSGLENLPKNTSLIVVNHQSFYDAILMTIALNKDKKSNDDWTRTCVLLGKQEVKNTKYSALYAEFLSSFYIDRKNPRTSIDVFNKIGKVAKKNKNHIVVFPEGTRSKTGELQYFKPGVFRIAKKEFIPIVPVTINNTIGIRNFRRKNWLNVSIIFHRPLKPINFITTPTKIIAVRVQKTILSKWEKPVITKKAQTQKVK